MIGNTLPNTPGVRRLTIGVTSIHGTRAAMEFTAPNKQAPLVAVTPSTEGPQLVYHKSANLGSCGECGKRTNQLAIERNSTYPYAHKRFKCAKCQRAINSGIETDGTDAQPEPPAPTEQELNEQYLALNDWQRVDGQFDTLYQDPFGGAFYVLKNAVAIQAHRDEYNAK